MSKEAMKLASDYANAKVTWYVESLYGTSKSYTAGKKREMEAAHTALQEALAEQPAQQEPAGYFRLREYGSALIHDQVSEDAKHNEGVFPLYTAPQPAQQQEPDLRFANPIGLTPDQKETQRKQFLAQQQEPVYFCDYGYEGWGKVDADMAAANIADGMTVEAYYTSPPAQQQEPVAWISVKDALPRAVRGISYKASLTDVVLVRHSDRPDYPITAHAVVGEGLGAGIAIPTEGASEHPEIAWYSASSNLNNPFDLKNDDYGRYLPKVFGSKITHWKLIDTSPQPAKTSKPWVGLTDDEIDVMANDFEEGYVFLYRSFTRAIEAKLRERNT